ncbi:hypothetical protein ACIQVA_36260 [Streptomyces microflavus]|uniref:Gfo/Idh/MocA family protein n=1 Tax=Streptomyces microflavus TaxID=1919 RepID=UPI00380BC0E3
MWTCFLPRIDVVRQVLEAGLLGEVHTVIADHGQFMDPDTAHRLFAPELAGGALLDLGIYPVSFASMVLGPFTSVTATGTKAFTGVDGQASVVTTNAAGRTRPSTPRFSSVLRPRRRSQEPVPVWRSRETSTRPQRSAWAAARLRCSIPIRRPRATWGRAGLRGGQVHRRRAAGVRPGAAGGDTAHHARPR